MRPSSSLLAALCLLSSGCLGPRVLADRSVGHVADEEVTIIGLCQTKTPGVYQRCRILVKPGDPIIAQELWLKWLQEYEAKEAKPKGMDL